MMDDIEIIRKENYIKHRKTIFRQFGIEVTDEMSEKIESLYPNTIAIENYSRKIILDSLDNSKK